MQDPALCNELLYGIGDTERGRAWKALEATGDLVIMRYPDHGFMFVFSPAGELPWVYVAVVFITFSKSVISATREGLKANGYVNLETSTREPVIERLFGRFGFERHRVVDGEVFMRRKGDGNV